MTKPHFLCIGAQKAGTSWLYSNLVQHPGIWMPPVKELHYFNHLFVPEHRSWTRWHIQTGVNRALKWHVENADRIDLSFVRYLVDLGSHELFTEEWYRRAFDRPPAKERVVGDITPEYSTIPEQGIAYLRQLLGTVKIIYLIRDPVDRALSQIRMNLQRRSITSPSEEQWWEAADSWDVTNRGDFRSYVPRWQAHFAEGDLLFLSYSELKASPEKIIRKVEAFLGIQAFDGYADVNRKVHKTEAIKVPEKVTAHLRNKLNAQTEFVRACFGEGFLA